MSNLIYEQKAFLTLYRRFYGQDYPAVAQGNTDVHILAQKMGYLLSRVSIFIGEYGYLWDTYGPCSAALQDDLRFLDSHPEKVTEFYDEYPTDDRLFVPDGESGGLFSQSQGKTVDHIVKKLKIREHIDDIRRWSELLGSLAFLSNSNMPGASFNQVNTVLVSKKAQYSNSTINHAAWKALTAANVI